MKKLFKIFLLLGLMSLLQASLASAEPFKVGVSPNGVNSVTLAKIWIPFLDKVELESQVQLRFATAPDILEFNQRLAAGEYDLVITDQYLYTIFRQKHQLSYIAELGMSQQSTEMALITKSAIEELTQIEGGLLAVKVDEKAANVKSLDKFLTDKGVTAIRDNVSSYERILQSVSESVHVAGLVPVSMLKQNEGRYRVLWRANNRHSYVLTAPEGASEQALLALAMALKKLSEQASASENTPEVLVFSVTDSAGAGG